MGREKIEKSQGEERNGKKIDEFRSGTRLKSNCLCYSNDYYKKCEFYVPTVICQTVKSEERISAKDKLNDGCVPRI